MNLKEYFKDKKVTVMGLGLLGRGVGDIKFLAEAGADLIVTDLKTREALQESLNILKKYKNIKYVLGEHRLEDFKNRDFVLKAAGVPLDSPYIAEARKNKIPIKMSASWFAELAKGVKIIGVTGTRGKSTTTVLIYEILRKYLGGKSLGLNHSRDGAVGRKTREQVFLGGNIRGVSTLSFLDKAKSGDIAVLELDSWQLQGFGEAKISPDVAVFTTFLDDHLNYYKGDRNKYFEDKANIFKYQKRGDVLVVSEDLDSSKFKSQNVKLRIARRRDMPKDWEIKIPGDHNLLNLACAIEATKVLGIPLADIKKGVESYKGVEGRLQYLKTVKGVKIYNDNNATTPDATIAALKALTDTRYQIQDTSKDKKIVLIMGGADKGLDMTTLLDEIPRYCKAIVLLPGSGSLKLQATSCQLLAEASKATDLRRALKVALKFAVQNDIILFSPAFASFGLFKNEYDRNDQFIELVKNL